MRARTQQITPNVRRSFAKKLSVGLAGTLPTPNINTQNPALNSYTSTEMLGPSKPSYASITATTQNHTTSPDIKAILAQLVALIPLIESGKAKMKDTLIMIISIFPLLLNHQ